MEFSVKTCWDITPRDFIWTTRMFRSSNLTVSKIVKYLTAHLLLEDDEITNDFKKTVDYNRVAWMSYPNYFAYVKLIIKRSDKETAAQLFRDILESDYKDEQLYKMVYTTLGIKEQSDLYQLVDLTYG